MSAAIEAAEKLRQQAIATLLDERGQLNEKLGQLGWNDNGAAQENGKKRGRPPGKKEAPAEAEAELEAATRAVA